MAEINGNEVFFGIIGAVDRVSIAAGETELQLDGTDVYAAGTTVLIEEEETT